MRDWFTQLWRLVKSHEPCATWRPKEVGIEVPSKSKNFENQKSQWGKSQSASEDLRTGDSVFEEKTDGPPQAERMKASFLHPCVLSQWIRWYPPTLERMDLLY